MKIALVGNSLWEMYVFRKDIINFLRSKGHDIWLYAAIGKNNPDIDVVKTMNIKFVELKLNRKGINPIEDLSLIKFLRKEYNRNNFDLIIHYTIKPNIYGSIASFFSKTPSIAVTTGLGYVFLTKNIIGKFAILLYKIALKHSQEVWFLNNDDKKAFLEKKIIPESKVFVLPGEGINLDEYKPLPVNNNDKTIFLMIARVLWDKGFREYVEAAKIIKKKYSNVEFRLLGHLDSDGNPKAVSSDIVEKYHRQGIISYLGVSDNVASIIQDSDCVILPSYREGIPRSLMEGSAMEKPIITTNTIGCKEVVDDNISGYLCNVKDCIDLASKIEKFLNLDKSKRIEMGKNGRTKMQKEFDVEIIKHIYCNRISFYNNHIG